MREIAAEKITETIARLFQEACYHLPADVLQALKKARRSEESPAGRETLDRIVENTAISAEGEYPLCQDTGASVVFLEMGQDVHISGGDLTEAIDEGVRRGYRQGYLRHSMVSRPFSERVNTGDNTPAIVHTDIVPGDKLKISVMPKGGGAENMSRLAVLPPSQGRQGVIDFVVNTVDGAGPNPCPPIIIGVGIGGTAETTLILAKKALLRRAGERHPDPEVAELEDEILTRVNNLGIGPMGYGGRTTALAVHAEAAPCHIASLPVAANLQCWCARHKETVI